MTDDKRQIKTLTPPKYVNYHNVFIADEHTSAYILFVITRNRSIFDQKIFCQGLFSFFRLSLDFLLILSCSMVCCMLLDQYPDTISPNKSRVYCFLLIPQRVFVQITNS